MTRTSCIVTATIKNVQIVSIQCARDDENFYYVQFRDISNPSGNWYQFGVSVPPEECADDPEWHSELYMKLARFFGSSNPYAWLGVREPFELMVCETEDGWYLPYFNVFACPMPNLDLLRTRVK